MHSCIKMVRWHLKWLIFLYLLLYYVLMLWCSRQLAVTEINFMCIRHLWTDNLPLLWDDACDIQSTVSLLDSWASAEQHSFRRNNAWIMSSSSYSSPHAVEEQEIVKVAKLGGYFRTARAHRGVCSAYAANCRKNIEEQLSCLSLSNMALSTSFSFYFWVQMTVCLSLVDAMQEMGRIAFWRQFSYEKCFRICCVTNSCS